MLVVAVPSLVGIFVDSRIITGAPAWLRLREGGQELALGLVRGSVVGIEGETALAPAEFGIEYLLLVLPDGKDETWQQLAKEEVR